MNPDAHELAARHRLGLMSPEDEPLYKAAAANDPSMAEAEREWDALAAAIALDAAPPVTPSASLLPRIQAACGLPTAARRMSPVFAWAGWGLAAALAVLLAAQPSLFPRGDVHATGGGKPGGSSLASPAESPGRDNSPVRPGDAEPAASSMAAAPEEPTNAHESLPDRAENRRLIQELATLRTELDRFRDRDREVFSVVPGKAWPVIIEMLPPESAASLLATGPAITTRVGEALAGITSGEENKLLDPGSASVAGPMEPALPVEGSPRAIPVYDPARDTGTLVIRDLPPAPEGYEYNLWVNPGGQSQPVLAGTLPGNPGPNDALDFSLGTTGILPASYQLTLDAAGAPSPPAGANIVLQGP